MGSIELLSFEEVATRLEVSVSTLRRMRKRGGLPAARRISPGRVRWLARDIDRWLRCGAELSDATDGD